MPTTARKRTDEPRPGAGVPAPQSGPPGNAVATVGPAEMVKRYAQSLAAVLPTHVPADAWLRLATNALRRGKLVRVSRDTEVYELELAAQNDPLQWIATLIDCARLGLTPGSEQYYITARGSKNGPKKILGIVGYIGYLDLIHRAGAVASVTCEVVRRNDTFVWSKGSLDRQTPPRWDGPQRVPYHEYDPWGTVEARGELVGAYMYCDMKDGSVSRVTLVNRDDIARSQDASASYGSDHSPWETDEVAMWLKTALRKGRKWVPTSTEYRREEYRAASAVQAEVARIGIPAAMVPSTDDAWSPPPPAITGTVEYPDGTQPVDNTVDGPGPVDPDDTGGADPDNDAAEPGGWPVTPAPGSGPANTKETPS